MRSPCGALTSAALLVLASVAVCTALAGQGVQSSAVGDSFDARPKLAPLPSIKAQDRDVVDLGRRLFFETRLSGDAGSSCATCHVPSKGWSDGKALSDGYPGSLYFRRTRSIVNSAHKRYFYWDGRMSGADLPTLVRDHISEAHFMQADGRLVLERLRQVPFYEDTFRKVMGGEPTYGRILNAVAAFVRSINSQNVPFDRFLEGDVTAISPEAKRGYKLFCGKAGCIQCHYGPMLSDGKFHVLGVPDNPAIFAEPMRHITYRRFLKTLGVSGYARSDHDVGLYALTKQASDDGRFKTPTLREITRTPPYMHSGVLEKLEDVIEFYNNGGGTAPNKDPLRNPLGLTEREKADLVGFLRSLSGTPIVVDVPKPLEYASRELGGE